MQTTQATSTPDIPFDVIREPHVLTQAEFKAVARVVRLTNHGRKWDVRHGKHSGFSDAATPEDAVIDVHHAFVNNALYLNEEEESLIGIKPSVPTREVLADYPDLVTTYAHVLAAVHHVRDIKLPAMSKKEYDAVLAALRLLGGFLAGEEVSATDDRGIVDILTDGGTHEGLASTEVHSLCERIQEYAE